MNKSLPASLPPSLTLSLSPSLSPSLPSSLPLSLSLSFSYEFPILTSCYFSILPPLLPPCPPSPFFFFSPLSLLLSFTSSLSHSCVFSVIIIGGKWKVTNYFTIPFSCLLQNSMCIYKQMKMLVFVVIVMYIVILWMCDMTHKYILECRNAFTS